MKTSVPNHRTSAIATATNYVAGVIGEGLKQNFLGADINMEYLTLTIRVMAIASVKTVQQNVIAPLRAKARINTKHQPINQPAF
jgi:hypothetical protein